MSGSNQAVDEKLYNDLVSVVAQLSPDYWSVFRSVSVATELTPSYDCSGNFEGVVCQLIWHSTRFGSNSYSIKTLFFADEYEEIPNRWLAKEYLRSELDCMRIRFTRWLRKKMPEGYSDPKVTVAA